MKKLINLGDGRIREYGSNASGSHRQQSQEARREYDWRAFQWIQISVGKIAYWQNKNDTNFQSSKNRHSHGKGGCKREWAYHKWKTVSYGSNHNLNEVQKFRYVFSCNYSRTILTSTPISLPHPNLLTELQEYQFSLMLEEYFLQVFFSISDRLWNDWRIAQTHNCYFIDNVSKWEDDRQNRERREIIEQRQILTEIEPWKLLPYTRDYVTYEGSMTSPGCEETVLWIIINQPIHIAKEHVGNSLPIARKIAICSTLNGKSC